jgi:hypothetical protein
MTRFAEPVIVLLLYYRFRSEIPGGLIMDRETRFDGALRWSLLHSITSEPSLGHGDNARVSQFLCDIDGIRFREVK